jgi:hypothetical protein
VTRPPRAACVCCCVDSQSRSRLSPWPGLWWLCCAAGSLGAVPQVVAVLLLSSPFGVHPRRRIGGTTRPWATGCDRIPFRSCRRSQHPCWGSHRSSELHGQRVGLYLTGSARRLSLRGSRLGSRPSPVGAGVHRWGSPQIGGPLFRLTGRTLRHPLAGCQMDGVSGSHPVTWAGCLAAHPASNSRAFGPPPWAKGGMGGSMAQGASWGL